VASAPVKHVSVDNNGIVCVSLEARSRRRERTEEVDKRGMRKQRRAGGEREEGREREGKGWGKADNERRTYQQVATAMLVTLWSVRTEEDKP
jgi:hypothetical protein